MTGRRNRSTDWLRSNDIWDTPPSRTSSGYSSTSGLSFKSDGSKDNIIDFKETRSILSPEQQRPESAGCRRNEWRTRSTDWLSIRDRIRLHKSRTSSGYSSTSGLSFKSDGSKDNTITDFKGRSSTLRADCSPSSEEEEGAAVDDDDDDDVQSSDRLPEQQRPESAGRRRNESRTRSTGNMSSNDILDILQERLKTSSMIIIHDFKESSSPSPEQQRPESAGRRMNEWRTRSTDWLRSNDIWDIPQDRLKTRSMIIIHDFKESSSPSPEPQRPESAGRRRNVEDNWSTDRLTVPASRSRQQSFTNYINFKKSFSLREKDTSLSTTPEIVVAGGMETS